MRAKKKRRINHFFLSLSLQNQDLARFPSPKVAHDERWEAVWELEPKDDIFRSFNFHHKSVGTSKRKKMGRCRICTEAIVYYTVLQIM